MSDSNTPRVLPDLTAQPQPEAPAPRKARKSTQKAVTALKKAATNKATPAKKQPAPKGRTKKYTDDTKITLLRKDCPPKRNGRNPYAIYAKVKTVGEFLAQGGYRADIPWDVKQGTIRLG